MTTVNDGSYEPWRLWVLITTAAFFGAYLAICWLYLSGMIASGCKRVEPTPARFHYPDAQLLSLKDKLG